MGVGIIVDAAIGQFTADIQRIATIQRTAASLAIGDLAKDMRDTGRKQLGANGFASWRQKFRVDTTPRYGEPPSANVSLHGYLGGKPPYNFAGVFEQGSRINGKPFLWLPLPGVPEKVAGYAMTPKRFIQFIGLLYSMRVAPGARPLLGAYVSNISRRSAVGKITLQKLQRGRAGGKPDLVPVFIGISAVQLHRKLSLNSMMIVKIGNFEFLYTKRLGGLL